MTTYVFNEPVVIRQRIGLWIGAQSWEMLDEDAGSASLGGLFLATGSSEKAALKNLAKKQTELTDPPVSSRSRSRRDQDGPLGRSTEENR